MNRRDFLKTFALTAAALGLGAVPVAEGEPAPDTLLGVPIELTDLDEPETVLIGPVPSELLDDAQFDLQAYIEGEIYDQSANRRFIEGTAGPVLGVISCA